MGAAMTIESPPVATLARRRSSRVALSLLLTLSMTGLLSSQAAAQTTGATTVEQLVERAVEQGHEVGEARAEIAGARAAHKAARTLYAPRIVVEGKALYFNESPTAELDLAGGEVPAAYQPLVDSLLPSGPIEVGERYTVDLTVTLAQPITKLGSIRELVKVRELDVGIAEAHLELARADLAHKTGEAALRLLSTRATVAVLEDTRAELEAWQQQVEAFRTAELVGDEEVLAVGVELAKLGQGLIKARSFVSVLEAQVRTLARLEPGTELEIASPLGDELPPVPPLADCLALAEVSRPELGEVRLRGRQAEAGQRAKAQELLPELTLVATYRAEAGTGFGSPPLAAGAVLSWTPVDWGQRAYELRQARADRRRAELALERVGELLALDVRRAHAEAVAVREQIDVAAVEREQAEALLRIERARFELHDTTAADLLSAETALLRARAQEHTTRYDYLIALSALRRATGGGR
jgi:outer membrane protein